MSKVKVITDSTAYLPDTLQKKYDIAVIPLTLIWNDETYQDGVDISPSQFYQRLQNSDSLPSTSQPSIEAFKKVFQQHIHTGNDIIAILISSRISGTVESALQAKQDLGTDRIAIVDSRTSGMAMGLQVLSVAESASRGDNLSQCESLAEQVREKTQVYFAVDTLEFLHRGGRIGGAKRFLGTMLDIKPILEMREGQIEAVDQVRTQRRASARIIQLMDEAMGRKQNLRLAVMHSNAPQRAGTLLNEAQDKFDPLEAYLADLSPVIGTHVGPGTLALAAMPINNSA